MATGMTQDDRVAPGWALRAAVALLALEGKGSTEEIADFFEDFYGVQGTVRDRRTEPGRSRAHRVGPGSKGRVSATKAKTALRRLADVGLVVRTLSDGAPNTWTVVDRVDVAAWLAEQYALRKEGVNSQSTG